MEELILHGIFYIFIIVSFILGFLSGVGMSLWLGKRYATRAISRDEVIESAARAARQKITQMDMESKIDQQKRTGIS